MVSGLALGINDWLAWGGGTSPKGQAQAVCENVVYLKVTDLFPIHVLVDLVSQNI